MFDRRFGISAAFSKIGNNNPSPRLLLGLLRFLLPGLKNLPHIALAGNPLLHLGIELAKLFLLRVCFLEKSFLALLQRLSLVFQLLSRYVLVLDSRDGQIVFVAVCVLGVCGEELFGRGEWEAVEDVADCDVLVPLDRFENKILNYHSLIIFTPSNLASQVPLLIVQVLQLQVQRVDFLPRFAGFLLGATHAEDSFAVQATEMCEVRVEFLLLRGELELLCCWV